MSAPYNGYPWKIRQAIIAPFNRARLEGGIQFSPRPCDMCGDPECPPDSWHSEDYSQPYLFDPPANYMICRVCHSRIHKRFHEPPENWLLYLAHLRGGGYGREFTKLYSLSERRTWAHELSAGRSVPLPMIRKRSPTGSGWWEHLTLDAESLIAAWARPRPLRPRPENEAYEVALLKIRPTDEELALLRFHARSPKRSVTMRRLAKEVLSSESPSRANLVYGAIAHRLCEVLSPWEPDRREDRSPIWMSVVAEGWQPVGKEREFEWVLIPTLTTMFA
ncbi:MAG: hypothetical protein HY017_24945 [Betaproteobacteria bacterium]|nr:hypothetical protein [Betaproteobacteria bacterium]